MFPVRRQTDCVSDRQSQQAASESILQIYGLCIRCSHDGNPAIADEEVESESEQIGEGLHYHPELGAWTAQGHRGEIRGYPLRWGYAHAHVVSTQWGVSILASSQFLLRPRMKMIHFLLVLTVLSVGLTSARIQRLKDRPAASERTTQVLAPSDHLTQNEILSSLHDQVIKRTTMTTHLFISVVGEQETIVNYDIA